jgi:L-cystine uptake protein TcyP (sodium:dicarboxylate symporter family)
MSSREVVRIVSLIFLGLSIVLTMPYFNNQFAVGPFLVRRYSVVESLQIIAIFLLIFRAIFMGSRKLISTIIQLIPSVLLLTTVVLSRPNLNDQLVLGPFHIRRYLAVQSLLIISMLLLLLTQNIRSLSKKRLPQNSDNKAR